MLLEAGADVRADNDEALLLATEKGHAEVVALLLAEGADIFVMHDWAVRNGYADIMAMPLEPGADINVIHDRAVQAVRDGPRVPRYRTRSYQIFNPEAQE